VLKNPSSPLLEEGILEYVYKRSGSDVSQPSSARNLLKKCINRTDNSERSPTEKKVIEIESRIRSLRTQAAAMRGMGNNFSQEIENLEKQLEDLEPILAAEKKEIEKLFKIKSFLDTTTKECYQAALKVRSAVRDQYLKQYLLLQKVLNPFLMHYLKDKSQELGVKVILDRQLVDSVVQGL
jgi:chromosome segregation ATPase